MYFSVKLKALSENVEAERAVNTYIHYIVLRYVYMALRKNVMQQKDKLFINLYPET